MIEIHSISPAYPIKKIKKIIREQEHQTGEQHLSENEKRDDEQSREISVLHIDEIV